MLFALGLSAYGAARLLARRPVSLVPLAGGLGLAYMIRPHVAFVVLVALAVALVFRRRGRATTGPSFGPLGRLILVVGLAVAASFMLGQAVDRFLPVSETTGVDAVGELLDQAESGTSSGGSEVERQTPNSPFEYPQAVFSVLFRPTIVDVSSVGTALSSAETTLVLVMLVFSWRRLEEPADAYVPPAVPRLLPGLHRDLRLRLVIVRQPRRPGPPAGAGVAVRALAARRAQGHRAERARPTDRATALRARTEVSTPLHLRDPAARWRRCLDGLVAWRRRPAYHSGCRRPAT